MNSRLQAGALLLLAACATPPPEGPKGPVTFPPPPDPPRMLFLRSVSSGEDVEPRESSWLANIVVGEEQGDQKPMGKPCAVSFHDGCFFVTDTEMQCIFRLDLVNKKAEPIDLQGRAKVVAPMAVRFAPNGNVYVADRGRKQVVVLDANFQWLKELGPWEDKSGPTDLAIWQDRLYVVDAGASCLRVLDLDTGKELQVLGKAENKDEFCRGPTNVAVDDNGFVYLVDAIYMRIVVWDKDGKFVRHVGKSGDAPGYLARPKGVTYADQMLWICDNAFNNCQVLDLDGRPLMFFGGAGDTPGCMSHPRMVSVFREGLDQFRAELAQDPDFVAERLVVVTNLWGKKINFYAFGKSKSANFHYEDVPLPAQPTTPPEPAPAPADAPK